MLTEEEILCCIPIQWFAKHFPDGMTLDQVGAVFEVTPERVRQIQIKALKRLRTRLEASHPQLLDWAPETHEGEGLHLEVLPGDSALEAAELPQSVLRSLDASSRGWGAVPDTLGRCDEPRRRPPSVSVSEFARWNGMSDREAWRLFGLTDYAVSILRDRARVQRLVQQLRGGFKQCAACGSILSERLSAQADIVFLSSESIDIDITATSDCRACGGELGASQYSFVRAVPDQIRQHLLACAPAEMSIAQREDAWVSGKFARSLALEHRLACACGWRCKLKTDVHVTRGGQMRCATTIGDVHSPPPRTADPRAMETAC